MSVTEVRLNVTVGEPNVSSRLRVVATARTTLPVAPIVFRPGSVYARVLVGGSPAKDAVFPFHG